MLYQDILHFRDSDLYTDAEKAAIEYAELFTTNHHAIDDGTFERLRKHFTEGEIVELCILVARHFAFGRLTKVLVIDHVCPMPGAEMTDA